MAWHDGDDMYKMDLVLTKLQWLICQNQTKPNQTKPKLLNSFTEYCVFFFLFFFFVGYFGFWFLIVDSVAFFLPHLNSLTSCLRRPQRKKKRIKSGRRDIFFNFNFISFGFSYGYTVARNVFLDYLSTVVSLEQGVEIHQSSSVVNKSTFSVVMSSGVFYVASVGSVVADTTRGDLASRRATLLADGWKNVLSV